jgi:predicted Rossmann-fold nucleotide-binding protein
MATAVVASLDAFREVWPDLRGVSVFGVDLRLEPLDWSEAQLGDALLLGCHLPTGATDVLAGLGVAVFPRPSDPPFEPYRAALYTHDELFATAGSAASLDARITEWFASSSGSVHDVLVRAVHDATIDASVARFVVGRRVAGVMGGHALDRDSPFYRTVAELGRALTQAGFTVATGGGPGVMEAANLGAWMAPFGQVAFEESLATLASAPNYEADPAGYQQRASDVRSRRPDGGESLGVPTWVYLDEPGSAFATHIAKYFTNSIREDGLLAIARSGVVYAPGSAGTEEEIFTDTAQNSLTLYKVRSPVVFLGRAFFEGEHPELVTAARRQADAFGWSELVTVCDEPDEVVAFIAEHDPDAGGHAGVERRRTHVDRGMADR